MSITTSPLSGAPTCVVGLMEIWFPSESVIESMYSEASDNMCVNSAFVFQFVVPHRIWYKEIPTNVCDFLLPLLKVGLKGFRSWGLKAIA